MMKTMKQHPLHSQRDDRVPRSRWKRWALSLLGTGLGIALGVGQAAAEGSADLIKRGKGYRASLMASDPSLGILHPDGRDTVSIHFVYANAGEYLNFASSAQGIGQGKIIYRDPTGMSSRCDTTLGLIPSLAVEKGGPAAGNPCTVLVEPGLGGIWEVEFIPPSAAVDPQAYEPVAAMDEWSPQKETDFWVRAWDISVTKALPSENGLTIPGRTYLRTFAGIIGNQPETGLAWNTIWFGRSFAGYVYALDTNGLSAGTVNLLGTPKGLMDEAGETIYGGAPLDHLGEQVRVTDPYAFTDQADEQPLKLYYTRPDQSLPAKAESALMGSEWLNTPLQTGQIMVGTEFDDQGRALTVTIEGEMSANAVELFDSTDAGPDGIPLLTRTNLPSGETSIVVPDAIDGDLLVRFSSKIGEMHFPMANIPANQNGIRLRRMNGAKNGAGDLSWNLGPPLGRFDGDLVNTTNSLRGVAGAWEKGQGFNRLNDIWAMIPVQSEERIIVPARQADLQLTLELVSIEPAIRQGAQSAKVKLKVVNDGPANTGQVRIDIGLADDIFLEAVDGTVSEDEAVFFKTLEAGASATAMLDIYAVSTDEPLIMVISTQLLEDSNLRNDVAVLELPAAAVEVPAVTVASAASDPAEPQLALPEPAVSEPAVSEPIAPMPLLAETPEAPGNEEDLALAALTEEAQFSPVLTPETGTVPEPETGTVPEPETGTVLTSETKPAPILNPVLDPALLDDSAVEADQDFTQTLIAADEAQTADEGMVDARLKTDLIALRKRPDSDQLEADIVFAMTNTGDKVLKDLSLMVDVQRHLGAAFVGIVGKPVLEVPPAKLGSWMAVSPIFTGLTGSDRVFLPGAALRPKDTALLRLTVHYDQDALEVFAPLSIRGDLFASVAGEEYQFSSDNDLKGGALDEDGDENPLNDSTPLPGMRLLKAVTVLPGPVSEDQNPEVLSTRFKFTLENTGGMVLHDLAMADLFLENSAVVDILDVQVLSLDTESTSFTASDIPDAFVNINNVERFVGGDAILQPGESMQVEVEITFTVDHSKTAEPLMNRAASFARIDLSGDGQLDTVIGDPADTFSTMGIDADGDGEEGNDATPVGFGRLDIATRLSGEIEGVGEQAELLLTVETTVANTGTAPAQNVLVELPLPAVLQSHFIGLDSPVNVVDQSIRTSRFVPSPGYNATSVPMMLDIVPVIEAGETVSVAVDMRFFVSGMDPQSLTEFRPFGLAEIDRDTDQQMDFSFAAVIAPAEFKEEAAGPTVLEQLTELRKADPANLAETTTDEIAAGDTMEAGDRLFMTTTDEKVTSALSTTAFTPASDGELLIAATDNTFDGQEEARADFEIDDFASSDDFEAEGLANDDEEGWDDDFLDDLTPEELAAWNEVDEANNDVGSDSRFDDFDDSAFSQPDEAPMDYGSTSGHSTPTKRLGNQGGYQLKPLLVRKLIPGQTIAFPAGSVPVAVTPGFQLAVPQGFQAYQAPDGSFFLVRKR